MLLEFSFFLTFFTLRFPQTDESYEVSIDKLSIKIRSKEIFGTIRALETISQLIFWNDENNAYIFKQTVKDSPRFIYRGFMLDTSRHFMTKRAIFQILDGMTYNKLNVFHWHIVDEPSFPYESKIYPNLTIKSAYKPVQNHRYSLQEISEIIEYARFRGIRVIPEFDTPGHASSWCDGVGFENFCTKCVDRNNLVVNGPLNPSHEKTYEILDVLWSEIRSVFKDEYIHLGGDEVSSICWLLDDHIRKWAVKNKIDLNGNSIQGYYMNRLYEISRKNEFKYMVWNEVFDGADSESIPDDEKPVVQIWKPWGPEVDSGWEETMEKATSEGYLKGGVKS